MEQNPVVKKLKIKPGNAVLILNAADDYVSSLGTLPDNKISTKAGKDKYDIVLLFVHNKAELGQYAEKAASSVVTDGKLWIAYPKISSRMKTDITRDSGWEKIDSLGWGGVSIISIDDIWSCLQFKRSGRGHMQAMQEMLVNRKKPSENREIAVPEDLKEILDNNPLAKEIFDGYAYTHRKEYVRWIEEAKRPETRQNRLAKTIEMLKEKKKLS